MVVRRNPNRRTDPSKRPKNPSPFGQLYFLGRLKVLSGSGERTDFVFILWVWLFITLYRYEVVTSYISISSGSLFGRYLPFSVPVIPEPVGVLPSNTTTPSPRWQALPTNTKPLSLLHSQSPSPVNEYGVDNTGSKFYFLTRVDFLVKVVYFPGSWNLRKG